VSLETLPEHSNASRMQLAAKLRCDDKQTAATLQKLIAGIEHL
jgi:hypothetical protein